MKFFNKLKSYTEEEAQKARLGFGVLRAKDYDTGKNGHLILLSLKTQVSFFIKKIWVPV